MTDTISKKTSISKYANNFINSNYSFLLPLLLFLIGIFNLLHFGLWNGEILTPWTESGNSTLNSNAWIGWLGLSLSTVGGSLMVLSDIYIIRYDRKFIVPMIIGSICTIMNGIIAGWSFTAISYFIMMIAGVWSWFKWGNESDETNKMTTKLWIFVLIGLITYILIGLILVVTLLQSLYIGGLSSFWSWSDVISSGVVLACYFVMLRKSKYGFLGFLITDLIYLIGFSSIGFWTDGAMYGVYLIFVDFPALLSWWESN